MFSDGAYIYLIGGFTKILNDKEINEITYENSESYICENIQIMKFDNLLETWLELKIEGVKPKLMVDPCIKIFDKRFLLVFSDFKYPKFWYLDIHSNSSNLIEVKDFNLNLGINNVNIGLYNALIYCEKEKAIAALEFNFNFNSKNAKSEEDYFDLNNNSIIVKYFNFNDV